MTLSTLAVPLRRVNPNAPGTVEISSDLDRSLSKLMSLSLPIKRLNGECVLLRSNPTSAARQSVHSCKDCSGVTTLPVCQVSESETGIETMKLRSERLC